VAHIEKRGPGRYRARYRSPDGRERSRTFDRKADAERWLDTSSADIIRGDWIDPRFGRMTFEDWVKRWEATLVDLRPRTKILNVGVARNYLVPKFGKYQLVQITTSDVKTMLAEEVDEGRLSISAVRRHVLVLRVILEAAVADGRIGRNPCVGVKLPAERSRPMRFLTADEVAQLANAISQHYRPLVLTAAYVGLRWGELAGLKVEKTDLLRNTIRVDEQLVDVSGELRFMTPKTKAGIRTVTMPVALREILASHFGSASVISSGLAFPSPKGAPMRGPSFRRVWQRALEQLRWTIERDEDTGEVTYEHPLAGLVFHELRHTAAALAVEQGAHPQAIKERLGHSSITVTLDRYGGLFPHLDAALADALDGVLRQSLAASPRPESTTLVNIRRSAG
jgi:integrase